MFENPVCHFGDHLLIIRNLIVEIPISALQTFIRIDSVYWNNLDLASSKIFVKEF